MLGSYTREFQAHQESDAEWSKVPSDMQFIFSFVLFARVDCKELQLQHEADDSC